MLSETEKKLVLDNAKLGATELARQINRIRLKTQSPIIKQSTLMSAIRQYLDDNSVKDDEENLQQLEYPQAMEFPKKPRQRKRSQDSISDECRLAVENLMTELGDDSLQSFWADILVDYVRE